MSSRILYIDDEQENLVSFKAVFRREYNITTAMSAREAMDLLEDKEYDIIISDQRMPHMTGVEFFQKIKDDYPEPIRMILTGYSDMQSIVDAINKGNIYYYINKPWKADELRVIINNALETRRLRQDTQQLKRENILAQYQILKNQVNPHFLFNSMNVLSSLIPRDQEKAVDFTKAFSKLYRSLLQLREQSIIALKEELEFVNAFIRLQKIRFEDALQVKLNISEEHLEDTLPPFSMQLVMENAIKHNIVSEEEPLQVSITTKNDKLYIINNLQKRKNLEDSTGIGLSNIKARYQLLGVEPPEFVEENNQFISILPLIKNT